MKRTVVLGVILVTGALAMVAAQGQQEPSAAAIKSFTIEKVKDDLYVIGGSGAGDMEAFSGGNTAVYIGETGVTLVDTKLPGFGPMLLEKVKSVTDKPIVRIINTHAHGDHSGGNAFFAAPVEIVVHENARANMNKQRQTRTYQDRLSIGTGRDQVVLYHFGRGHTNGDTFVVFPAARTMHAGDMFAWKDLPFVDDRIGGSVIEQPDSLARAVATIQDVDTVIPGHIPPTTWNEFREYVEFTRDFVQYAEAAQKAGKSVDQAAKEYRVPDRFKGYTASNVGPDTNLKIAYNELSKR